MKKIGNREFKIGLVTIICLLILFFGIDYLKGINIFKPENYYIIKYKNVAGLATTGPVTLDGFKVGIIREINYDFNDPGNVLVEISLDKKLRVPEGSKAVIITELLGTAYIDLKLNNYVSTYLNIGDTLQGDADPGLMGSVSQMMPTVENLLPKIDSILSGLDKIVNESKLQESFININGVTKELEKSAKTLNSLMGRMPSVMNNISSASDNLAQVTGKINNLDFESVIASANETLANTAKFTSQLNSRDNSLGLLLNSDELYKNLNNVLNSTDSLVIDLKKNPKRYVHFSKIGRAHV